MSVLVKQQGALNRVDNPLLKGMLAQKFIGTKYRRLYPDSLAWKKLSPMMQATIKTALKDAAGKYGCSERDLIVSVVFNNICKVPMISVKKRERIVLNGNC